MALSNDKDSRLNFFDMSFRFQVITDIKFQLMTSFCLQIARMMYWNIAASKLRKVTVIGDI